jgi:hypothetical protein
MQEVLVVHLQQVHQAQILQLLAGQQLLLMVEVMPLAMGLVHTQIAQVALAVVRVLQPTQVRLAHQGKEMLAEQIPVDQAIAEAVEAVQGLLVGMPPQHLRVILVA